MLLRAATDREALAVIAFLLQRGQDWHSGYAGSGVAEPGVGFYAGDMAFKPAGAIVCRNCGVEDRPAIGPGVPPHAYRATCAHCGAFVKWLSGKSQEQRDAQREKARKYGPATPAQLAFLKALGHAGPVPQTIDEASALIEQLKAAQFAKGERYWPGKK